MFKSDAIGNYPIHVAVSSGSLDCLRVLLNHEAKTKPVASVGFFDRHLINLPDNEGETPLHLAVNSGNADMIDVSVFYPLWNS